MHLIKYQWILIPHDPVLLATVWVEINTVSFAQINNLHN